MKIAFLLLLLPLLGQAKSGTCSDSSFFFPCTWERVAKSDRVVDTQHLVDYSIVENGIVFAGEPNVTFIIDHSEDDGRASLQAEMVFRVGHTASPKLPNITGFEITVSDNETTELLEVYHGRFPKGLVLSSTNKQYQEDLQSRHFTARFRFPYETEYYTVHFRFLPPGNGGSTVFTQRNVMKDSGSLWDKCDSAPFIKKARHSYFPGYRRHEFVDDRGTLELELYEIPPVFCITSLNVSITTKVGDDVVYLANSTVYAKDLQDGVMKVTFPNLAPNTIMAIMAYPNDPQLCGCTKCDACRTTIYGPLQYLKDFHPIPPKGKEPPALIIEKKERVRMNDDDENDGTALSLLIGVGICLFIFSLACICMAIRIPVVNECGRRVLRWKSHRRTTAPVQDSNERRMELHELVPMVPAPTRPRPSVTTAPTTPRTPKKSPIQVWIVGVDSWMESHIFQSVRRELDANIAQLSMYAIDVQDRKNWISDNYFAAKNRRDADLIVMVHGYRANQVLNVEGPRMNVDAEVLYIEHMSLLRPLEDPRMWHITSEENPLQLFPDSEVETMHLQPNDIGKLVNKIREMYDNGYEVKYQVPPLPDTATQGIRDVEVKIQALPKYIPPVSSPRPTCPPLTFNVSRRGEEHSDEYVDSD